MIKKYFLIILLFFIVINLMAVDNIKNNSSEKEKKYIIENEMTLYEISKTNFVPIKKLVSFLNLEYSNELANKTIEELGITKEETIKQMNLFNEKSLNFAWTIVLIGMLVVFIALSLTWVVVSQLKHFSIKEKKAKKNIGEKTIVKTSLGKISTPEPDVSTNSIIAVITALHLHILEAEEKNNMILTWKRAPISMWKQYYKIMMPNREYKQSTKRG